MESVSTYSEARNEYLKQLCTWIVPYMIQHYRNVWANAARGGQQKAMVLFQERCAEVPKWNQDTIDENVGKLLDSCRCDYLEELMAAVFIAHTKVLIAIRVSSKHKKLQITLPKLDHFIHRVFSECARSFWKAPYLFLDDQKPIEMQKNLLQAEALCNDAIGSAVRSLLPIKNILNEYLADDVLSAEPVIEESATKGGAEDKIPAPVAVVPELAKPEPAAAVAVAEPVVLSEPVAELVAEPVHVAEPTPVNSDEKVVSYASPSTSDDSIKKVSIKSPDAEPLESVSLDSLQLADIPSVEAPLEAVEKPTVEEPEEITIDTEPASVHFSNYDNVFDESNDQVASFKYVPKDLEPGEIPKLEIKEESGSPLSLDSSITDLEAPGSSLMADELLE